MNFVFQFSSESKCGQSSLYAKTTWIEFLSGIFAQDLLLFTWILNVGVSDLWNICWNGILSRRIVLMCGCLLRKLNCGKRFSFPDRSVTNNRPLPIREFLFGPPFQNYWSWHFLKKAFANNTCRVAEWIERLKSLSGIEDLCLIGDQKTLNGFQRARPTSNWWIRDWGRVKKEWTTKLEYWNRRICNIFKTSKTKRLSKCQHLLNGLCKRHARVRQKVLSLSNSYKFLPLQHCFLK